MTERRKRILRIAGYAAYFVALFAYFVYLGFPYAAITNRVISRLQASSQLRIEVAGIAPDLFSGFKLRDVRIYHGEAVGSGLIAKLDVARVRVGLLSLLRGNVRMKLRADLYGGTVAGAVRYGNKVADVDLTLADLTFGQYDLSPFLGKFGDFRLDGKIGGVLQAHYDAADLKAATGKADLKFDGLRVAETTVYGVKVPAIAFQPSALKLELGSRAVKVVEGKFKGDNMEVDLGGRMTLRDDFGKSNFSFFLKFKPTGELAGQFGGMLDVLKKKDREGYYRVNLTGTPSAPRFR
jgi:type II secretion system protein N